MTSKIETEIEVISDDDESLKVLGELLSNKTSRELMKFLMNKSTYKMKISDEMGVPFSLVEHHLKKMEVLGLVKVTNEKIIKGGVMHKTYKITAHGIFILLNHTKEELKQEGSLKRIFKEGIKIVTVGMVSFLTWTQTTRTSVSPDNGIFDFSKSLDIVFYEQSMFFPMLVIITGLIIHQTYGWKKRKKGLIVEDSTLS